MKRKKIGFITALDPTEKSGWANVSKREHTFTVHNMATALEAYYEVEWVDNSLKLWPKLLVLGNRICNKLFFWHHSLRFHSLVYASQVGKKLSKQAAAGDYDLLFAPKGSTEIAFLQTKIPIVYHSDATFERVLNYLAYYSNLAPEIIAQGHKIEKMALQGAQHIIFLSDWAKKSAMNYYGIKEDKISVIPSGADLALLPSRQSIRLEAHSDSVIKLLFVGVDWDGKGGEIAFNATMALIDLGVETSLTIVGCQPPAKFSHPSVTVISYINKNTADGMNEFQKMFHEADFLIVPTRAECAGIIFCEASAFGLPSITTDTGGVSGHVEAGVNGQLLPYSDNGAGYARCINELWNDKMRYNALRKSSRNKFEKDLNWEVWGCRVREIFERVFRRSEINDTRKVYGELPQQN